MKKTKKDKEDRCVHVRRRRKIHVRCVSALEDKEEKRIQLKNGKELRISE